MIKTWTLIGIFLVSLMIIVGGVTRITDSGLSITKWEVVSGVIPPLNYKQWNNKFNKYKQTTEFNFINYNMTINQFKKIYWWEYTHRLLGRTIGVFFMLPLLFKGRFFKNYFSFYKDYVFVFLLVVIQGFAGWYMVKSGLVDRVDVSHYRLAIHLILAVLLFSYLWWIYLSIINRNIKTLGNKRLYNLLCYLIPIFFLQIIFGAFMSGTEAGKIPFPFPFSQWFTDTFDLFSQLGVAYKDATLSVGTNSGFLSLFENRGSIQFIHRVLGMVIFSYVFYIWLNFYFKQINNFVKKQILLLLLAVLMQFLLGVFILFFTKSGYMPIHFRILHQLGFLFFLFLFIRLIFYTKKRAL